jgi:DNA helicase-2/ATP-dependent DNA helicase PcrA
MLDLSTLNPPQLEAVKTTDGPLLVLAGAGSGKTRVIAHRVAWLLQRGLDPRAILAVTFTNKAAAEMRERVASLAGQAGSEVRVATFHAFGLWLLSEEHAAAGLPRRFAVADAGDQQALVKRCMREVKVDDRAFDPRRVLWQISRAKNALQKRILPRPEGQGDDYDLIAAEVFPRYQQALRAQRAVDFDDLIARPVELLKKDQALREKYQGRFSHLLVDEYQDTNACQLELLKLLAGRRRNVCAVGDDDQAIYGWRGAEVKNILRFQRHFPGAREVRLEQNYRSTGHILACAHGVISRNAARKPKQLWTSAGAGQPVRVVACESEEEEARFLAGEISRLRGEGRPWSDFAVLYRLNAQSRPVEEALRETQMPHQVHGGSAFFDRSEVRDLLAYLKVVATPDDEASLARIVNVPPRGIGDATVEKVHAHAVAQGLPLLEALRQADRVAGLVRGAPEKIADLVALLDRTRAAFRGGELLAAARRLIEELDLYAHARSSVASLDAGQRKVDGIDGILRSLEWYQGRSPRGSLAAWLQRLALDSREEEDPAAERGISLMTLHASKGLEYPVVFIIGAEEDLLPCAGIQGEPRDLDEERRLAYVGITRARELLYLTRATQRLKRGKVVPRTPSRFLEELPAGAHQTIDPNAMAATPEELAVHTSSGMAELRARLAAAGGSG